MLSKSSSRSRDSVGLGVNSSVIIDKGVGCEKRVADEQKVTPLNNVGVARKPSACYKADQMGGLEDSDSLTMDAGGGVNIYRRLFFLPQIFWYFLCHILGPF